MGDMLERLKLMLDSEEGKKLLDDFCNKLKDENDMLDYQLDRCFNRYGFKLNDLIDKIIDKYSSKEYRDRWYSKGFEPEESLYWFLFKYAKKYGNIADESEYYKYGNCFTSEMHVINGYYIMRMDGQGSVIKIIKKIL